LCPGPPYSSSCVPGEEIPPATGVPYTIQSITLANTSGNNWTLTIQENAPFSLGSYQNPTAFGDFLIDSNPQGDANQGNDLYYGIVLGGTCGDTGGFSNNIANTTCGTYNGHNSLTAGGLYQDPLFNPANPNSGPHDAYPGMYQTAGAVGLADGFSTSRSSEPVWVDGTKMGVPTGASVTSFTVSRGAVSSDNTYALYTITDNFVAPAGFLSNGNFSIDVSSYVCANWLALGPPTAVPEPRALFLLILPLMFFLGRRLNRSRETQVS